MLTEQTRERMCAAWYAADCPPLKGSVRRWFSRPLYRIGDNREQATGRPSRLILLADMLAFGYGPTMRAERAWAARA